MRAIHHQKTFRFDSVWQKSSDPARKARFVWELRATSALNHPNIITIHDVSQENGVDLIAMEYVGGPHSGPDHPCKGMRLDEARKIDIQIADTLARAHAVSIINQDLKPPNSLVESHGHGKVLDFGLANLA